ncbi:hypothetical protein ABZ816_40295 [Actinosynnema sp. NPDC047251]|uniref:Uncharacterized protein n=1 Tax=Saccharothrix espanaensis (strain ATCC 51144 / DSM 44229 / JCM 9112 / NBRC 15066 / NRRL 15764) TaxID=1179773 RepID=K0K1D8_SACES|nr:hypothetical protein [Saccharothrix espanaensis]CCH32136.1 hypothetical protein BN6_48640 [Saccharothrix espanaensis DSM 44229]
MGAFGHSGGGFAAARDARCFNPGFVENYDGPDNPAAWARTSNVDTADRLAGSDFKLLIVPEAEHTLTDCLAYVRTRCWDFLVRELMGTRPPAYRPAPIALGELFS